MKVYVVVQTVADEVSQTRTVCAVFDDERQANQFMASREDPNAAGLFDWCKYEIEEHEVRNG